MGIMSALSRLTLRALGTPGMGSLLFDPFSAEYREASRLLEEWRVTDFSGMVAIARSHLGDTPLTQDQGIRLRHVALVRRISRDYATQYIATPQRDWGALDEGPEKALRARYRELRVDQAMQLAQRRCAAQQSAILVLLPSLSSRRRARLLSFLPYEVEEVRMGDAAEVDLRFVEEVRLTIGYEVPGAKPMRTELATLVLTRTHGYIELVGGTRIGVWADDLSHPYPYLPAFGVRLEEPTVAGSWLPALAGDVRSGQIGLSVGLSDSEDQVRELSPGLQVLSGPGAEKMAAEMKKGANRILVIPKKVNAEDGSGLQFEYHETRPSIDQYLSVEDKLLALLASYRYISPAGLRGDSADAKEVERDEQYSDRMAQEGVWREAEDGVADLIIRWHNWLEAPGLAIPPGTTPDVIYRYQRAARNDLQSAQARAIDYAMGRRSPADDVETGGRDLSPTEREDLVDVNIDKYLAWRKRLGDHVPAGLDAVATFIGMGGAETAPATPPATPAVGADPTAGGVAETAPNALNGAQIAAVLEVAAAVGGGTISLEGGVAILRDGLGLGDDTARRILSGAKAPPDQGGTP